MKPVIRAARRNIPEPVIDPVPDVVAMSATGDRPDSFASAGKTEAPD